MNSRYVIAIIITVLIAIGVIIAVVFQVREYSMSLDPKLREIKKLVKEVFYRDDYTNFVKDIDTRHAYESVQLYSDSRSYTINKHKVYLCLYDKNRNYHTNNTLIFVFLHEMAHVMCDEIGHTDKFWDIFGEILKKAAEIGIYNPSEEMPDEYCGHY